MAQKASDICKDIICLLLTAGIRGNDEMLMFMQFVLWRQWQWATLTRRENCETKQAAWSSNVCTAGHFFHVNVPVDADVTSINNLFMAENDNILRCDDNVDDDVSKSEDKIADDQMTAEVAAGNKTALPTSQLIPTNFAYTRLPTLLFHTQHTLYPLSAQTQNPPFVQYPPSYSIGYTLDQKDPSLWSTNGHYLPIYAYMHMQYSLLICPSMLFK